MFSLLSTDSLIVGVLWNLCINFNLFLYFFSSSSGVVYVEILNTCYQDWLVNNNNNIKILFHSLEYKNMEE